MKVKLLNQCHPTLDLREQHILRALASGGRAWRELVSTWLPQHPEEAEKNWSQRKARALYQNHAGPIVGMLSGAVFTEAPACDGLDPDFLANVDGEGTPAPRWFGDRLLDALVGRRVYAWVNLPARPPELVIESRADEEAAGLLRPFLVAFRADQVIDWETDDQGRLVWLMVHDLVERRPTLEDTRSAVWRWTYIDRQRIRRWEWRPEAGQSAPSDEAEAAEVLTIEHRFGELPVARLELPDELHAMGKLRDPAIAHLRARNDLSWALHRAAHALLYIKSKWSDEKPVLGPGYYLKLGVEDEVGYAEPSGANFELLREDVRDLREELYRVVHQMAVGADSSATRSRMSGESKAEDWHAMEIVLSALADLVRAFMVDTLRLVNRARGSSDQVVVKGLDGWQEEDLEVWLAAAMSSTEAHRMSPTFQRAVAKRQAQRVLQGADPEVLAAIEAEIDEAEIDPAPYRPPPPIE